MAVITTSWPYDSALIFFSFFIVLYLYVTRNFKYWEKRGVKEIKPIPFFGNLAPVYFHRKPFTVFLQEYYKAGENEPYIGLYCIDRLSLIIRDPELINHILIKDFDNFSDRSAKSTKYDVIGNSNMFTMKNIHWKYIRDKMSPLFTSKKLKIIYDSTMEIEQELDTYMNSLGIDDKERSIEMSHICAAFIKDMLGASIFGVNFNTLKDEKNVMQVEENSTMEFSYVHAVEFVSTLLAPSIVNIFNLYIFGKDFTRFARKLFKNIFEDRLKANKKGRGDLIDVLIDMKKNKNENFEFADDELLSQAIFFYVAGNETSATIYSFALFHLARNPEVQDRLRKEIFDELNKNNGKITYEMLMSSFPFLDMVISETLRMYPFLTFIERRVKNDYQVPNDKLIIKSGTSLIIPVYSLHMDEKYFPKPYVFDPERFSEENKKKIKSNTYIPFGNGPRMCIGMRLGFMTVKIGLIHLISKYEFSPCKDTRNKIELSTFTLFLSLNDIILNVKKISSP